MNVRRMIRVVDVKVGNRDEMKRRKVCVNGYLEIVVKEGEGDGWLASL